MLDYCAARFDLVCIVRDVFVVLPGEEICWENIDLDGKCASPHLKRVNSTTTVTSLSFVLKLNEPEGRQEFEMGSFIDHPLINKKY